MPYINEEERSELDSAIEQLADVIGDNRTNLDNPHDFSNYLGRINYCFTRILMLLLKEVSYKKIAMATGVLENIKQELYRRVAENYEDKKIAQHGDVREYKKLK
jgi:hypothetical protein